MLETTAEGNKLSASCSLAVAALLRRVCTHNARMDAFRTLTGGSRFDRKRFAGDMNHFQESLARSLARSATHSAPHTA